VVTVCRTGLRVTRFATELSAHPLAAKCRLRRTYRISVFGFRFSGVYSVFGPIGCRVSELQVFGFQVPGFGLKGVCSVSSVCGSGFEPPAHPLEASRRLRRTYRVSGFSFRVPFRGLYSVFSVCDTGLRAIWFATEPHAYPLAASGRLRRTYRVPGFGCGVSGLLRRTYRGSVFGFRVSGFGFHLGVCAQCSVCVVQGSNHPPTPWRRHVDSVGPEVFRILVFSCSLFGFRVLGSIEGCVLNVHGL